MICKNLSIRSGGIKIDSSSLVAAESYPMYVMRVLNCSSVSTPSLSLSTYLNCCTKKERNFSCSRNWKSRTHLRKVTNLSFPGAAAYYCWSSVRVICRLTPEIGLMLCWCLAEPIGTVYYLVIELTEDFMPKLLLLLPLAEFTFPDYSVTCHLLLNFGWELLLKQTVMLYVIPHQYMFNANGKPKYKGKFKDGNILDFDPYNCELTLLTIFTFSYIKIVLPFYDKVFNPSEYLNWINR